ncbi:uncharacterized protein LOC143026366 isoform X2 [Oratosquilla oratoria]|uniref:uncharacterized protein LOC143026366 isoform X2 n=1 Tax=Oratosquilla oratoria TaxID=337810 RepID=UPI003F7587C3
MITSRKLITLSLIKSLFVSGQATTIMVNMNVRSMGPFSEKQESYSMQLYLRQVWHDPRLRFNGTDWGLTEFSMNWMFAERLWKPETFFINGKNSYAHKITAPNMFIRLAHNGQITWSMRLTVRASCQMHLRKFPLDTQECPLRLASYGYSAKDMVYKWDPAKLVTVDPDVSIAQYELINITTATKRVIVRRKEEISTLTVVFSLKRLTGFFLLQVYVPCILIVCCSWVAFWITKKDVPGRVALGALTVLSMTNLGFGGRSAWPAVSYATALDYFVILCFAFVFAAVLEFASIHFMERLVLKQRAKLEAALKDMKEKAARKVGGEEEETAEGPKSAADALAKMTIMAAAVTGEASKLQTAKDRAAERDGTMVVTTTIHDQDHPPDHSPPPPPDIKETLKDVIRVPLSVVGGIPDVDKRDEESWGEGSMRDRSKLTSSPGSSLSSVGGLSGGDATSIMSGSAGGVRHRNFGGGGDGEGRSEASGGAGVGAGRETLIATPTAAGASTPEGSVGKGLLRVPQRDAISAAETGSQKDEGDITVIKVDLDTDEESPPPPPYTVWQILTSKSRLMAEMSPRNTIPSEDDLLERFSIIDLYARRIFPATFFFLFTTYWILFNYYITDEFPTDHKENKHGFVDA